MRNIKLLWGLTVCLAAAVLVLSILLIRRPAEGAGPEEQVGGEPEAARVVAKIGDRTFKLGDLRETLVAKYGPEELGQLLDREAVRLEADHAGIKISREDVDAELKRMQQGYDSEEQFYESMKTQLSMSKEDLREDVYYRLLQEKIATTGIPVSPSEVDAYIREHPEEFQSVSMLRIQQIINKTADQAKRTMELYRSGKDFAQLAKERSLDTATASDGGDLGWVEDKDPFIAPEILKAARGMRVGEIAGPIETAGGYAVILLKDKKEQTKGTSDEIRRKVEKQLALQKAPPMQDVIRNLRDKYHAEILEPSLK